MPNFKLSHSIIHEMTQNAAHLTQRRVSQAQLGFPLTVDEVQRAIVPAEALEMFRRLEAMRVTTIQKSCLAHMVVPALAGSPREALIGVLVDGGGLFEMTNTRYAQSLRRWAPPKLECSVLAPEKEAALAKWTANLVQEYRLAELAKRTVKWFLNGYAETTGHILARWPGLVVLVSDHDWKQKFRDAPRSLRRWEWGFAVISGKSVADYEKHKKAMALTDVVLAGASLLPKDLDPGPFPRATIHEFGRIEGDKD